MKTVSRLSLTIILVMLLSTFALSTPSIQCDAAVNDQAGVLGNKTSQVGQAAASLNSKGADTRILATNLGGYSTLDALVDAGVKSCPSWQAPNGKAKSTLVIIAVAPKEHKMGIYAGTAFESAFGADRMNRYKTQFMSPHFKAGEWAEGLVAAANQMSARLTAYTAEANAPVTNTTVNEASQPTDFKGLWIFLWIVAVLAVGVVIYWMITARKAAKEEEAELQQRAIAARNQVATLISELTQALSGYNNNFDGKPNASMANSTLDSVSVQYSQLAGTLSGDPTQENLGEASYRTLEYQFDAMINRLRNAKAILANPTGKYGFGPTEPVSNSPSSTPTPNPPAHEHSHTHTTERIIERDNSGNDFATGVLLGSVLSRPSESYREPYREPERHEPEPEPAKEPEPSFSTSSGSSSFEEDDDKPSFSSDSGSSDFSSGGDDNFSSGSGSDSF